MSCLVKKPIGRVMVDRRACYGRQAYLPRTISRASGSGHQINSQVPSAQDLPHALARFVKRYSDPLFQTLHTAPVLDGFRAAIQRQDKKELLRQVYSLGAVAIDSRVAEGIQSPGIRAMVLSCEDAREISRGIRQAIRNIDKIPWEELLKALEDINS